MKERAEGWGVEDNQVVVNLNSQKKGVEQDKEEKRGSNYKTILEPDVIHTNSNKDE